MAKVGGRMSKEMTADKDRLNKKKMRGICAEGISSKRITAKDITMIGMMVAVIEVCKVVLMSIPNVELTTFWIIMFSIFFGNQIFLVIPVFILLEGTLFGFGLWWVMYLYVWPLLAIISRLLRRMDSVWAWSILAGAFGLLYGFFCSFPYFVMGAVDGGFAAGLRAGFTWFIAGIPFDLIHGAGNFVIMLILYRPVRAVMSKVKQLGN